MSEKDKNKPFALARQTLTELTGAKGADKIAELTARGQNLSNAFENLDPTIEHSGIGQNFDAFERFLLAADLVPRSVPEYDRMASSCQDIEDRFGVARATDSTLTRALIGEVIRRAYWRVSSGFANTRGTLNTSQDAVLGTFLNQYNFGSSPVLPRLEPAIKLADLLAASEGTIRDVVKPFYMNDLDATAEVLARIAEGTEVPAIEITNKERLIHLKKAGIRVDATYEVLRQSPIDTIAYTFQRIAIRVDAKKVDKVIGIGISGDGNAGTAATNYALTALDPATTAGNLTLKAWLAFKKKFKNPFLLTHIFGQEQNTLKLELLNTGSANIPLVMAGGAFNQQFIPMNDKLRDGVRIGDIDSVPANLLLGIDGRVAFKRWFEIGSQIREVDKWIREQKESFVMTETEGYQVEEPDAVKTLQLDA